MQILNKTIAVLSLAAGFLMAQPPGPPDPATMVEHRVARLTTVLSLTTAQAAQATTIFTAAQTAITPLQTSLEQARESTRAAVKSNATGTIDALAATMGTVTGQILAIQGKADASFYAILTTEQKAKFDAMPPGRGPGGPGPGPDGFGGPGMMGRGRRQ